MDTEDALNLHVQLDDATRMPLVMWLRIIEDQARGIALLLDDGCGCDEFATELNAQRAASQAVAMQTLDAYALAYVRESAGTLEVVMSRVFSAVIKLTH